MTYIEELKADGAPYKSRLEEVSREYPLVTFQYKAHTIIQDLSQTKPNANGGQDTKVDDSELQYDMDQALIRFESTQNKQMDKRVAYISLTAKGQK